MKHLRTIDPGGPCLGYAYFIGGELTDVGLSRTKLKGPGERAVFHAQNLEDLGLSPPERNVSEMMRHRGGRSGVPPQDLIELNLIAGHLGSEWVYPEEWKGRVPKEVHQPRILACLNDTERALVEGVKPPSLRHNAIDAVGIGLYVLGRLKPCPKEALPSSPRPSKRSTATTSLRYKRSGKSSTKRARSSRAKAPSSSNGGAGSLQMPKKLSSRSKQTAEFLFYQY